MSSTFRTAILLAAAFGFGSLTMNQSASVGQETLRIVERWEYRIESGNEVDVALANRLGREGWELVQVYRQNESDLRVIYKRRS
jgi:hypothetical protein